MNIIKNLAGDFINKVKYGDPAKDARQMLLCMVCMESLCEPIGYLSCHHMVHMGCLWDYYNIQTQKKSTSGSWTKADPVVGVQPMKVECPVCSKVTFVPLGNDIQVLQKAPENSRFHKVRSHLILDFREQEEGDQQQEVLKGGGGHKNTFYNIEFQDYDGPQFEGVGLPSSQTTNNAQSARTIENNLDRADSTGHHIVSPVMKPFLVPSTTSDNLTPPPGHIFLSSEDNNPVSQHSSSNFPKSENNLRGTHSKHKAEKETGRVFKKTTKICCRKHGHQLCTHICDTCELPVCEKCTKDNHKGHPVSRIAELLASSSSNLKTLQEELKHFKGKEDLYEGQLEYLLQQQEDNFEQMKNKVIRHASAAKDAIEAQKVKLIKELENAFRAQRDTYDRGIKQIRYHKQCTQKINSILKQMLHESSQAHLLMNRESIRPRIKTHFEDSKDDSQWISWLKLKAVFDPLEFKIQLGELHRESIELPDHVQQSIDSKKRAEENSRHPLRGIQHEMPQVCWNQTDTSRVGQVESANPQGALFLEDNSLLIAYEGKQCISKYVGKQLDLSFQVFDKENLIMPRDMAQLDRETVVATDSRYMTLRLFDNDGSNLRCLQKEVFRRQRPGEQSNPFGVATLPTRHVAVSDETHQMVYIVDPAAEKIVSSIGPLANGKPLFKRPQFLSFDPHLKRILVTDAQCHTVKLFDLNGTLISEIGNPKYIKKAVEFHDGTSMRQYEGLQQPAATAIDMNGNILVVDGGHHQICQFDRNGDFVSIVKLYEKTKPVSLHWPRGIAIGPTGQVAITEKMCAKVIVAQLYK